MYTAELRETSLDAGGNQEDPILFHIVLALVSNGSKNLFLLVKEADVTWRNMENRCAEQNFLFEQ